MSLNKLKVLVLAHTYEVVGCISWKKAVELFFRGKVDVIEEYDTQIHSPSITINLPCVVRFKNGFKYRKFAIRFSRENIYIRDEGKCQYCNKAVSRKAATLDHIVAKKHQKNGTHWTNIVLCCIQCNIKKGDKSLHEANLKLAQNPKKPTQMNQFLLLSIQNGGNIPDLWKPYLIF